MGTLFSALDIGRNGLFTAQVQLDVAGHNISNVNTDGFSRQRVDVSTRQPNVRPFGAIGRGPFIAGVERIRDPALDAVFRQQAQGLGAADAENFFFARIEDIFQEPSDTGLSSRLNFFFDAMSQFADNVESLPARQNVMSEAIALAGSLNEVDDRIRNLQTNANDEVVNIVDEINSLADRIAELNGTIRQIEGTGRAANDLRDRRDLLLDELAQLVNITYREQGDGRVTVLLGGEELVVGNSARLLQTAVDPTVNPDRPDFVGVQFENSLNDAIITSGELFGTLRIRDEELTDLDARFDAIAAAIVQSVNNIQAQGVGLANQNTPLVNRNAVDSVFAPIGSTGLPFDISDGSFDLVAYDANTGDVVETLTINVDPDITSLDDIASAIRSTSSFTALTSPGGTITIDAVGPFEIGFLNDTSGTLSALGLNGLFTGTDASDIGVNQRLIDDPRLLSSGGFDPDNTVVPDPLATGDNSAALAIAALRNAELLDGGTQTINKFFESTVVRVGVNSRANQDTLEVERAFVADIQRRRQEISGVSIDEEVTNLIRYQRAFEGSARVVTVADRMLQTLINIVQ